MPKNHQGSRGRPLYEVEVARDVPILSLDGNHRLSADVYRPACEEVVPALVMLVPYRKDAGIGIKTEASLRWLAGYGYGCLLVDFSGTGTSDGSMRPPFDANEVDDAVAAIDWAVKQPWCSGKTGMWGASYGAIVTMRTASKSPPSLKAIIPINGATDAEREFIHPHGQLGGLAGVTYWGTLALANHVLPPIRNFHDHDEQVRWRRRVDESEPWIMDLVRHGPGADVWRNRAFDPSTIQIPALCVAGWRDLFHEAQIRAFEQMRGPKKLVVGPWMHTSPQSSPFEPIDFMSLALRWWDYWLQGVDNGVMDEPIVTVYIQGHSATWRGYATWPPANSELRMSTAAETTLHAVSGPAVATRGEDAVAEYDPDPTIGSLGGLWSVGGDVVGMPLDQHDDDMRGVAVTSEPLEADQLIAGRPTVTVRLTWEGAIPPERLVVRLTDVDRASRSTLITSGVVCPTQLDDTLVVPLYPTAYRLAAGHRLRVALSDSDFPRLWPLASPQRLRIMGIELTAPTAAESAGGDVDLPRFEVDSESAAFEFSASWQITRDPPRDGLEVVMGDELAGPTSGGLHQLEVRQEFRASVRRPEPAAARLLGAVRQTGRLETGEVIEVVVNTELTTARLRADATVDVQGARVFDRRWDVARSVDAAGVAEGEREVERGER